MNWYLVKTAEVVNRDSVTYFGTSQFEESVLMEQLAAGRPVVLENLTQVSIGGELKSYSEDWEPHPDRIWMMPANVLSVVPLKEGWQKYKKSWDESLLNKIESYLKDWQK